MNRLATLTITVSLTAHLFLASIACSTNGGDIPLTLNKAIEIAVTNNTITRQAVENQKAAIEEQKSARADFLPKASAGYSYARLKDNPCMKTGKDRT